MCGKGPAVSLGGFLEVVGGLACCYFLGVSLSFAGRSLMLV
jgi:hypothetical protein